MRRSEGVVHIQLGELGQRFCEIFVVGFFFWMKAQVFEQQDLTGVQFLDHLPGFPSDAIGRKSDVAVSTLGLVE